MFRTFCRVKIHSARISQVELEYQGSITIPLDIMKKAGILPHEKVQVVNLNNGERLETYVIPGKENSGIICLNGPAARTAIVGDRVHILSYAMLSENQIDTFKMKVVRLDDKNRVIDSRDIAIDNIPE